MVLLICTGKWQLIVAVETAAAAATASAASIRVNAGPCTFRIYIRSSALHCLPLHSYCVQCLVCGIQRFPKLYFCRNFVNVTNLNFKYRYRFRTILGRIIMAFFSPSNRDSCSPFIRTTNYSIVLCWKIIMTKLKSNHNRLMEIFSHMDLLRLKLLYVIRNTCLVI